MSDLEILRPAEAAEWLGLRTLVVITAMHEKRVARVRLPDGTLGIPAESLHLIGVEAGERGRLG